MPPKRFHSAERQGAVKTDEVCGRPCTLRDALFWRSVVPQLLSCNAAQLAEGCMRRVQGRPQSPWNNGQKRLRSIRQAGLPARKFRFRGFSRGLCGRPLDPFAVHYFEGVLFRNFIKVTLQINSKIEDIRRSPEGEGLRPAEQPSETNYLLFLGAERATPF